LPIMGQCRVPCQWRKRTTVENQNGLAPARRTQDEQSKRATVTRKVRPPTSKPASTQGLLKTLPEPETDWPSAGRVKWLQTAANIFDLIYKSYRRILVTQGIRRQRLELAV